MTTGYITETSGGITMYATRKSAARAAKRALAAGDGNGVVATVCAEEHVTTLTRPVTFTADDQSIRDLSRAIYDAGEGRMIAEAISETQATK